MFDGFCDFGTWGSFGDFGIWGWLGLILNLIFWGVLIAGVVVLVVWVMRRAQVPAGTVPYGTGRSTPGAILQTQYARGDISREQFKVMKQVLDKPKD